MISEGGPVRFLASVTSVSEVRLAASCGADIIDCKDPSKGALGALPIATIRAIRSAVARRIPVSATIGDLPCEPGRVADAVGRVAATGVEFVKIGLYPGGEAVATIATLGTLSLGGSRLVGVLLADRGPDFGLLDDMSRARFAGAMLDTAGKSRDSLVDHLPLGTLRAFIRAARDRGMFAGLAGSLRLRHIADLLPLAPDVLGFRGALCRGGKRGGEIEMDAICAVRRAIGGGAHDAALERPALRESAI